MSPHDYAWEFAGDTYQVKEIPWTDPDAPGLGITILHQPNLPREKRLAVSVNQNRTIYPLQPGFHVAVASVYRLHSFIAAFLVQINFMSGVSIPVLLMVGAHIPIVSAHDTFFNHIGRPVSGDLKFATRKAAVHRVRAPQVRHKYPGGSTIKVTVSNIKPTIFGENWRRPTRT
jgi:hypothetical protein